MYSNLPELDNIYLRFVQNFKNVSNISLLCYRFQWEAVELLNYRFRKDYSLDVDFVPLAFSI